jgi:hypothetical protein
VIPLICGSAALCISPADQDQTDEEEKADSTEDDFLGGLQD